MDILRWHSVGFEAMKPVISIFDEKYDEGQIAAMGDSLVGYAKLDGVFAADDKNEVTADFLRVMTIQIALVSWELSENRHLIQSIFPYMVERVATTPYISEHLANISSSTVEKYVHASLNAGMYMKKAYDSVNKPEQKVKLRTVGEVQDNDTRFIGTIPREIIFAFIGQSEWPIYDDNNQIVQPKNFGDQVINENDADESVSS